MHEEMTVHPTVFRCWHASEPFISDELTGTYNPPCVPSSDGKMHTNVVTDTLRYRDKRFFVFPASSRDTLAPVVGPM